MKKQIISIFICGALLINECHESNQSIYQPVQLNPIVWNYIPNLPGFDHPVESNEAMINMQQIQVIQSGGTGNYF